MIYQVTNQRHCYVMTKDNVYTEVRNAAAVLIIGVSVKTLTKEWSIGKDKCRSVRKGCVLLSKTWTPSRENKWQTKCHKTATFYFNWFSSVLYLMIIILFHPHCNLNMNDQRDKTPSLRDMYIWLFIDWPTVYYRLVNMYTASHVSW